MSSHLSRAIMQMEKMKEESLIDFSLDLHFKELEANKPEPEQQVDVDYDVVVPVYDTTLDIIDFKGSDENYRAYFKRMRALAVDDIIVVVEEHRLQGDEVSQARMVKMIQTMGDTDIVNWIDADNDRAQLNKVQLTLALSLASKAQTDIWVK